MKKRNLQEFKTTFYFIYNGETFCNTFFIFFSIDNFKNEIEH
jgi:hypothetical protein